MVQKKRSSKRPRKQPEFNVTQITKALSALPLPARAIVRERIDDIDRFRQQYPDLYELMFKNVDCERYREFEREIERAQRQKRGRT